MKLLGALLLLGLTIPAASAADTPVAVTSGDCLPTVSRGIGGAIFLTCDGSGNPCGIAQAPVCWTVRYACMNALGAVLRLYDYYLGPLQKVPDQQQSGCEGQPGW